MTLKQDLWHWMTFSILSFRILSNGNERWKWWEQSKIDCSKKLLRAPSLSSVFCFLNRSLHPTKRCLHKCIIQSSPFTTACFIAVNSDKGVIFDRLIPLSLSLSLFPSLSRFLSGQSSKTRIWNRGYCWVLRSIGGHYPVIVILVECGRQSTVNRMKACKFTTECSLCDHKTAY